MEANVTEPILPMQVVPDAKTVRLRSGETASGTNPITGVATRDSPDVSGEQKFSRGKPD
jgi:hypothetical protein